MKNLTILFLFFLFSTKAKADLLDGGFETFDITGYGFYQGGLNTPWLTTAQDGLIEGWSSGFLGVNAFEGNYFAELNANYSSTLYQDINGLGDSQQINWHFAHRGRNGIDTMRFTIADLGFDQLSGGGDDTILYNGDFSDGNFAWGIYGGTVTSIGNLTRFAFEALSAVGGSTQGNFLDDCGFGDNVPVPAPGTASLMFISLMMFKKKRKR